MNNKKTNFRVLYQDNNVPFQSTAVFYVHLGFGVVETNLTQSHNSCGGWMGGSKIKCTEKTLNMALDGNFLLLHPTVHWLSKGSHLVGY